MGPKRVPDLIIFEREREQAFARGHEQGLLRGEGVSQVQKQGQAAGVPDPRGADGG